MKNPIVFFFLILFYTLALLGMGYFFPRSDFYFHLGFYVISFISYMLLYRSFSEHLYPVIWGIGIAILLRLLLFGAIPVLSDDFYRFIWDGQLIWKGINPYLQTPEEVLVKSNLFKSNYYTFLIEQMNSPAYYSVYTPLNQVFFALSAGLGGQNLFLNVFWLKIILMVFELLNFFLIFKILKLVNQPITKILLYAFNPLVILEVIGNVHFEGMLLTGLLGSVYFYLRIKPLWSGPLWAWAVAMKLSPLMFGPLFLRGWRFRNNLIFFGISGLVVFAFFIPLLIDHGYYGFLNSVSLYQGKFEFNASVYYLFREIGELFLGYNPIGTLSPLLNTVTLILILVLVYKAKDVKGKHFIELLVAIYLIYLMLQPVVHPWYLIPGFGLSVLTDKRAFLAWSGLVFLSYHAYANAQFQEIAWVLILEYAVLILFIIPDYLSKFAGYRKSL